MDDNGTSNGGGNGSVYWQMRSKKGNPNRPVLINAKPVAGAGPGSASARAGGKPSLGIVEMFDVTDHPGRGEVKVGPSGVEGHTDSEFGRIGLSRESDPANPRKEDHKGKFRVSLRFRKEDLDNRDLISEQYKGWILANAVESRKYTGRPADTSNWDEANNVYVVIDVPAIKRNQPANAAGWDQMPWEIHWEW